MADGKRAVPLTASAYGALVPGGSLGH